MIDRKTVTHVYAVLRYDRFHSPNSIIQNRVTIKELHPTMEIAVAEVERLNRIAKESGVDCVYWWQTTRWRGEPLHGMHVEEPTGATEPRRYPEDPTEEPRL